jgi:hypothetical protein
VGRDLFFLLDFMRCAPELHEALDQCFSIALALPDWLRHPRESDRIENRPDFE